MEIIRLICGTYASADTKPPDEGRTALKGEKFEDALVLLLEADKEYKSCTSALLDRVDNYALLNLDVAWGCAVIRLCVCWQETSR